MNVEEISRKRRELERELCDYISERVSQFTAETGLSVSRVDIDVVGVHLISKPSPDYQVGKVSLQVVLP